MDKYLHIISFDIPYPANYGGVIDVYYKLKNLHSIGVKIILHCFKYNDKKEAPELNEICEKVYYYKRNTTLLAHFSYLPYTVFSRKNSDLLDNLLKDDYPILFEGLMSCYYLSNKKLADRVKIFRECNIEHDYYRGLSKATNNPKKKAFYVVEALKQQFFEKNINSANVICAISTSDEKQLKCRYPEKNIKFISGFHQNDEITSQVGLSDYILYHANLQVEENEIAAGYLCHEVFSKISHKCIISGLNPSQKLKDAVSLYKNVSLIANPDKVTMETLIQNAQVNILITFQGTGLKLKLLNTVFSGRHLVVNNLMLEGSSLDDVCNIADSAQEQILLCNKLMQIPFTEKDIEKRKQILFPHFSNRLLAEELCFCIWE